MLKSSLKALHQLKVLNSKSKINVNVYGGVNGKISEMAKLNEVTQKV